MATETTLPVGSTGKELRGLDRGSRGVDEVVTISDSENPDAIVRVLTTTPALDTPGLAVRVIGDIPIGTEVEIKNDAGNPVPVSGDFYPATQTVDGTVNVGNFPAEYPLPAAQVAALTPPAPYTGGLTNDQLRASPVPVTGTFTGNVATFTDVLSATGYNLASAAYDQTYTFSAPARLSGVIFTFTTTSLRRVQIFRGTQPLYDVTSTDLMLVGQINPDGFPATATLRVLVTQTPGACLMTLRATIEEGSAALGGTAVTVSNTPTVKAGHVIPVRQLGALYTLRSQRFVATTGYVTCALNATTEILALLRNPTGSGKVIILDQAEFGSTANARFSRFGGGTFNVTGSPKVIGVSDGSAATSIAQLYSGGTTPDFTVTTPGTLRKVATMLAYDTYQILGINGTSVLRPGAAAYWRLDEAPGGGGGSYTAFIDFEWWELPEADFAAMQAAALSQALY